MTLEIRRCEEADFPEFVRIQIAAFSAGGMTTVIKPHPLSDSYVHKSIDKHIKSHREDSDVTYLKVIDTALDNKIIACAKWRINKTERTEEHVKASFPSVNDAEGRLATEDFYRYLADVRWNYMGTKPFAFLHILVTDPAHHRRGAGAMLIKWGTKIADEAGLPSFLESTMTGKPLYARCGFEVRKETHWNLSKYGGEGTDTSTVMIREPVGQ